MEENLFVCFEYNEGEYVNGYVASVGEGGFSSVELSGLESEFLELEGYEGDLCNIITIKPFIAEEVELAHYLIRYLVEGKGSFRHVDLQYSSIKSLDDIKFIEMKFAEELGVDSVVITDFDLITELDDLDENVIEDD